MGDPNVLSSETVGNSECNIEDGDNTVVNRASDETVPAEKVNEEINERKTERAGTVDSLMPEDSASVAGSISGRQSNGPKRNVRERYHFVKQQYPELIKRLDQHRTQTPNSFEWLAGARNPLVLNATHAPFTSTLRTDKNSTPKETWEGIRPALPLDVSAVEPSINKLNHSFTYPEDLNIERKPVRELPHDSSMDEDFVNSKRRMRRARGLDYSEHMPSGIARSDVGDFNARGVAHGGYRPHSAALHHFYDPRSMYSSYRDYAIDGRRSVGLMHQYFPYDGHGGYSDVMVRRRPQSSFEAAINPRHGIVSYDGEEEIGKKSNSSSTGSDEEVAAIHYQQEMARRSAAAARFDVSSSVSDEFYYFGVIQLSQDKIQSILYKTPPPPGYFHLPPMEKAAYLFYFMLYNRYFTPVEEFHNRFNREFFKYSCEGDSAETALWKICKHTQEEFIARRSAYQLKAYEKTQKQLFSDDRETPDSRVSDHGSRYDQEEESDRLSIDSASKEPLKFRTAHAFARFCVGGKVVIVNPEKSSSVIELRDVKSLVVDSETKRLIGAVEMFHGPLIPGVTPPHSVSLYIQRQIDHIMKSDIYKANPHGSDASDCLLVWQLLKMIVQQQGRVTGPDIARLLMSEYDSKFTPEICGSSSGRAADEGGGFQRYMQFLLGGHVDEAVDSAIKDGLILDAMVLARWVCPHKLEKVDAAFLAQRAEQNPVMTLLSVAHELPAPILLNPPTDDAGSWRSHAAIILANLSSDTALKMVYNLGKVLARREYHAAADFCFLAVSLLADYDPFAPITSSDEDDGQPCQHMKLVHSSLPDDDVESVQCSFGFSVVDLHATEIYEYGLRLDCNGQPVRLTQSCEYQKYRFKYAQLLSEYGGFVSDAYRYCVEIAKGIADKWSEYGPDEMLQLCDLADRLQHVACADQAEIAWFSQVRGFIEQYQAAANKATTVQDTEPQLQNTVAEENAHDHSSDAQFDQMHQKTRTLSFGSEAAEWHADHQEPIQMSPITSTAPSASILPSQQQHNQHLEGLAASEIHESQQHHILAQRRTSLVNSMTSSAGVAQPQAAFPPPVPSSQDNVDSLVSNMQSLSVNEQNSGHIESGAGVYSKYFDDRTNGTMNAASGESTKVVVGLDRREPEVFVNKADNRAEQLNDFANIQNNVVKKNENCKHSMTETSPLEVPSPSGMDDSVFTTSDDHSPLKYAADAAKHPVSSDVEYRNNLSIPPVPPVSTEGDDNGPLNLRTNTADPGGADENKLSKPSENSKSLSVSSHSSGIFGMLKAKIAKAIPSSNEMILPDDKNPSIVWDPVQQKYVGDGVTEDEVSSKPPSAANSALLGSSGKNSGVGLTAARLSGGSRYFNMFNDVSATQSTSASSPTPVVPPLIAPPTFGFIPTQPDNDDAAAESPFSVDTSPPVPSSNSST